MLCIEARQCTCSRLEPILIVSRGVTQARVAGGAEGAHENVGTAAIGEPSGSAGVVDEQLFAGTVRLTHRALELRGVAAVVSAEL